MWLQTITLCATALLLVAAQEGPETWRIGIKEFSPFVSFDEADLTGTRTFKAGARPTGFSIDLMDAIAAILVIRVEYYVPRGGALVTLLEETSNGDYDAAIAGITVTKVREQSVDFSHAMFISGLGILTLPPQQGSLLAVFGSGQLWFAICTIILLSYLFAVCVWMCEHSTNEEFQGQVDLSRFDKNTAGWKPIVYKTLEGLWESIWWSFVTVTTVGYGDKAPKTKLGRICAIIWLFLGLAIFGITAGTISAELTAVREVQLIQRPTDLAGLNVAVVDQTTSVQWVESLNARAQPVLNAAEGFEFVEKAQSSAFVYDHPVLLHYANTEDSGLPLLPTIFEKQYYGIAFPPGSVKRERVNDALLEIQETGKYNELYDLTFGVESAGEVADPSDLWQNAQLVWVIYLSLIIVALHCCGLVWLGWNDRSMTNLVEDMESGLSVRTRAKAAVEKGDQAASTEVILERLDQLQAAINAITQSHAAPDEGARRHRSKHK